MLGGESPEHASKEAKETADVFADLFACLVKVPLWWSEAGWGLDLLDFNVPATIYAETVKIRVTAMEEIQKKGEEDGEKLKKLVETQSVK